MHRYGDEPDIKPAYLTKIVHCQLENVSKVKLFLSQGEIRCGNSIQSEKGYNWFTVYNADISTGDWNWVTTRTNW